MAEGPSEDDHLPKPNIWSLEKMREKGTEWTMEGDVNLISYMQQMSKEITSNSKDLLADSKKLKSDINKTHVECTNVATSLCILSEKQFVEHVVKEGEGDPPPVPNPSRLITLNDVDKAVTIAYTSLLESYEKKTLFPESESDSADDESDPLGNLLGSKGSKKTKESKKPQTVLCIKSPFHATDFSLPYRIGTTEFYEHPTAGIELSEGNEQEDAVSVSNDHSDEEEDELSTKSLESLSTKPAEIWQTESEPSLFPSYRGPLEGPDITSHQNKDLCSLLWDDDLDTPTTSAQRQIADPGNGIPPKSSESDGQPASASNPRLLHRSTESENLLGHKKQQDDGRGDIPIIDSQGDMFYDTVEDKSMLARSSQNIVDKKHNKASAIEKQNPEGIKHTEVFPPLESSILRTKSEVATKTTKPLPPGAVKIFYSDIGPIGAHKPKNFPRKKDPDIEQKLAHHKLPESENDDKIQIAKSTKSVPDLFEDIEEIDRMSANERSSKERTPAHGVKSAPNLWLKDQIRECPKDPFGLKRSTLFESDSDSDSDMFKVTPKKTEDKLKDNAVNFAAKETRILVSGSTQPPLLDVDNKTTRILVSGSTQPPLLDVDTKTTRILASGSTEPPLLDVDKKTTRLLASGSTQPPLLDVDNKTTRILASGSTQPPLLDVDKKTTRILALGSTQPPLLDVDKNTTRILASGSTQPPLLDVDKNTIRILNKGIEQSPGFGLDRKKPKIFTKGAKQTMLLPVDAEETTALKPKKKLNLSDIFGDEEDDFMAKENQKQTAENSQTKVITSVSPDTKKIDVLFQSDNFSVTPSSSSTDVSDSKQVEALFKKSDFTGFPSVSSLPPDKATHQQMTEKTQEHHSDKRDVETSQTKVDTSVDTKKIDVLFKNDDFSVTPFSSCIDVSDSKQVEDLISEISQSNQNLNVAPDDGSKKLEVIFQNPNSAMSVAGHFDPPYFKPESKNTETSEKRDLTFSSDGLTGVMPSDSNEVEDEFENFSAWSSSIVEPSEPGDPLKVQQLYESPGLYVSSSILAIDKILTPIQSSITTCYNDEVEQLDSATETEEDERFYSATDIVASATNTVADKDSTVNMLNESPKLSISPSCSCTCYTVCDCELIDSNWSTETVHPTSHTGIALPKNPLKRATKDAALLVSKDVIDAAIGRPKSLRGLPLPGKLKDSQRFKINPTALLPGATHPRMKKDDAEKDSLSPDDSEESSSQSLLVGATDGDPTGHSEDLPPHSLLHSLNKERPKVSGKRRPSTRKGRKEAAAQESSGEKESSPPTESLTPSIMSPSTDEDDAFNMPPLDVIAEDPKATSPSARIFGSPNVLSPDKPESFVSPPFLQSQPPPLEEEEEEDTGNQEDDFFGGAQSMFDNVQISDTEKRVPKPTKTKERGDSLRPGVTNISKETPPPLPDEDEEEIDDMFRPVKSMVKDTTPFFEVPEKVHSNLDKVKEEVKSSGTLKPSTVADTLSSISDMMNLLKEPPIASAVTQDPVDIFTTLGKPLEAERGSSVNKKPDKQADTVNQSNLTKAFAKVTLDSKKTPRTLELDSEEEESENKALFAPVKKPKHGVAKEVLNGSSKTSVETKDDSKSKRSKQEKKEPLFGTDKDEEASGPLFSSLAPITKRQVEKSNSTTKKLSLFEDDDEDEDFLTPNSSLSSIQRAPKAEKEKKSGNYNVDDEEDFLTPASSLTGIQSAPKALKEKKSGTQMKSSRPGSAGSSKSSKLEKTDFDPLS